MSLCCCSRCFQSVDQSHSPLINGRLITHTEKASIGDLALPTYQQATELIPTSFPTIGSRPHSAHGILFIDGKRIMKSNGSSTAVLYELTQSFQELSQPFTGDLKDSTRTIGLARIDRDTTGQEPASEQSQIHVFDLQQVRFRFAGYSRQSLCVLCKDPNSPENSKHLEARMKRDLLGGAWKVQRLASSKKQRKKPASSSLALKAYPKVINGKAGFEWRDGRGEVAAYEIQVGAGQQTRALLNIIKASSQDAKDFMVAVWCMRVWSAATDASQGSRTLENIKRIVMGKPNGNYK